MADSEGNKINAVSPASKDRASPSQTEDDDEPKIEEEAIDASAPNTQKKDNGEFLIQPVTPQKEEEPSLTADEAMKETAPLDFKQQSATLNNEKNEELAEDPMFESTGNQPGMGVEKDQFFTSSKSESEPVTKSDTKVEEKEKSLEEIKEDDQGWSEEPTEEKQDEEKEVIWAEENPGFEQEAESKEEKDNEVLGTSE